MSGAIIGVLFATIVVVSAVSVGIAAPSSASGTSASQEHVDAVSGGVQQSLVDVNTGSTSESTGASAKSLMSTAAWEHVPSSVRPRLKEHVGAYVAQMEAQSRESGRVTRVEPAGSGVTTGTFLQQSSTSPKTVTKKVTETYTDTVTRTERQQVGTRTEIERQFVGYRTKTIKRQVFDHFERVKTGRTMTIRNRVRKPYTVPVYRTETRLVRRPVTKTELVPVYDTYQVTYQTENCYYRAANSDPYERSKKSKYFEIVRGTFAHCETWFETKTEIVDYEWNTYTTWTWKEVEYKVIDHYETEYRTVFITKEVPVYEKQPVYKTVTETKHIPVYEDVSKTVPVYDQVQVTEKVTKTRTVTKKVTVETAQFTYKGQANWTLASDVTDARRATVGFERDGLSSDKSRAMTLRAVDQSGDTWQLRVWRNGETVVVETSSGVHEEVNAAFVQVDLVAGTIAGRDASVELAAGLDEPYELQIRNGDKAYGTYEFVLDGTSPVSSTGSLTVKDDIIYKAVFDITYATQDTTYTDRTTITPAVGESS